MAKSTVDGASAFDGATNESYPNDLNWWNQSGAQRFIANEKLVVIIHYGESNCANRKSKYGDIYGETVSFLCEDTKTKGYIR